MMGSVLLICFVFCVVLCFCPVSCVPNVASVSGLFVPDCSFGFHERLFSFVVPKWFTYNFPKQEVERTSKNIYSMSEGNSVISQLLYI